MKTLITYLIVLLIFSGPYYALRAQEPEGRFRSFEDLTEGLTEESDSEEESGSLLQELQELNQHPVRLNSAGLEELLRIPFLNEVTASAILDYRQKHDEFYSKFELASVPGISRDLAEKISFFVTTETPLHDTMAESLPGKKTVHQILMRTGIGLPLPEGYRSQDGKAPSYAGSPQGIYLRYHLEKSGLWQAGITGEKDPGETFFKGSNRSGFDFYSAHVSFRINRFIPQVILGDYTIRTGQGLVCWQGFSIGKSSAALQSSKNLSQMKPYTSTNENRFFRGAAVLIRSGHKSLGLFLSSRKTDGNLSVTNDSALIFSSLQTSGYHRTLSETDDKRSVRHTVAGAVGSVYSRRMKAGLTLLAERFRYPFMPGDQLYEKFYFNGQMNFNAGADYHWISGKFHLFGETACSKSGGIALVNGFEAFLHDQFSATVLFRHFDKNYQATWASVFASNPAANNETGFYAGIRMLPAPGLEISAYLDLYYAPWIKYTTSSPSRGYDYSVQGNLKFSRKLTGYIRYKNRERPSKTVMDNFYTDTLHPSGNLRLHCRYDINYRYALTWRVEMNRIGTSKPESGLLCYQDFAWTPPKDRISAVFRLSWFRIPSFLSRIYVYESDLLYAFSTVSLFGSGFRSYLKIKVEPLKNLEIWCKLACTCYPGTGSTGSGNGENDVNLKSEGKFQVRYRF
jgi:hypothetical protein